MVVMLYKIPIYLKYPKMSLIFQSATSPMFTVLIIKMFSLPLEFYGLLYFLQFDKILQSKGACSYSPI